MTRHTAALAVARGDLQHGGDSVSLTRANFNGGRKIFDVAKFAGGDLFKGEIIFHDTRTPAWSHWKRR